MDRLMRIARKAHTQVVWTPIIALTLGVAAAAESAADSQSQDHFSPELLFEHGRCELTFDSGALFSPIGSPKKRPTINYTITEVELGYMLGGVKGHGWWRGNFEVIADGFASAIFEGPGTYTAGFTAWLRYNFVPSNWRVVPYAQAGAGLLSTDIDRGIVGQPFNFNLNAGASLRYFLSPRWSIELEYRYQHISNANLGKKNVGINSQGPILGVSYFF